MASPGVPFLSRPTFYYDRKAALLTGVYLAGLGVLPVVAKKTLGASDMQVALLTSVPIASFLLALYWGHFVRQRRKMPTVVIAWSLGRGLFLAVALQFMPLVLQLLLLPFWGGVADRLNPMLTRTALSGIWGTKLPAKFLDDTGPGGTGVTPLAEHPWEAHGHSLPQRVRMERVPVPPPAIV